MPKKRGRGRPSKYCKCEYNHITSKIAGAKHCLACGKPFRK